MSPDPPALSRSERPAQATGRRALLVCIGLFWLLFGSYLLYNRVNAWPEQLDLNQLVAPSDALMPAIQPLTTASAPPKWGSSMAPQLFDENVMGSGGALVVVSQRVQHTPDAAIEINQLVARSQTPAATAWEFFQARPGAFDLQSGAPFSEIALDYRSPAASQQRVVCVLEADQGCRVSYIWARYGQYLVRVRLAGEGQALPQPTVSALFQQIDLHVTEKLGR